MTKRATGSVMISHVWFRRVVALQNPHVDLLTAILLSIPAASAGGVRMTRENLSGTGLSWRGCNQAVRLMAGAGLVKVKKGRVSIFDKWQPTAGQHEGCEGAAHE